VLSSFNPRKLNLYHPTQSAACRTPFSTHIHAARITPDAFRPMHPEGVSLKQRRQLVVQH